MKNHFHLLVQVKESPFEKITDKIGLQNEKGLHSIENIISKSFSDMFNSYTKSINVAQSRTGGLFETPFCRILVENDAYFTKLIWYINFNPQKHGFVSDFRNYLYSSYHSLLSTKLTKLARQEVVLWFGSSDEIIEFHNLTHTEESFKNILLNLIKPTKPDRF